MKTEERVLQRYTINLEHLALFVHTGPHQTVFLKTLCQPETRTIYQFLE